MRARSSAVFDSVVIYGIKVEEIQSRVSFWCGALNFRIFFDLLMFACQVTQRPYPQLQQLQQSLNMCWNHSEATIAKPAGLWDSQIRTEHAHVSTRPRLLHNNHRRFAQQNFYLWTRSSAVFDLRILWNMASKYWVLRCFQCKKIIPAVPVKVVHCKGGGGEMWKISVRNMKSAEWKKSMWI